MKKKPDVEILEVRLRCPECNYVLETDVCNNCGCEIVPDKYLNVIKILDLL